MVRSSGSRSVPCASSALPRKYLSPGGADPAWLSARKYCMYVSTNGVYWRSNCTSTCSCATILATTSSGLVSRWAVVASGKVLRTKTTGRILGLHITASSGLGPKRKKFRGLVELGSKSHKAPSYVLWPHLIYSTRRQLGCERAISAFT